MVRPNEMHMARPRIFSYLSVCLSSLEEQRSFTQEENLGPVPFRVFKINAHEQSTQFLIEEWMLVDNLAIEGFFDPADLPAK